jgi:hypothetical protein
MHYIFLLLLIILLFYILHTYVFNDTKEHMGSITVESNEAIQTVGKIFNSGNVTVNNLNTTQSLSSPKITLTKQNDTTPQFNITTTNDGDYIYVNNSAGKPSMTLGQGGDAYFTGDVYAPAFNGGQVRSSGPISGLIFDDRGGNPDTSFQWYSVNNTALLDNHGTIMSIDNIGNMHANGDVVSNKGNIVATTGNISAGNNISGNGFYNQGNNSTYFFADKSNNKNYSSLWTDSGVAHLQYNSYDTMTVDSNGNMHANGDVVSNAGNITATKGSISAAGNVIIGGKILAAGDSSVGGNVLVPNGIVNTGNKGIQVGDWNIYQNAAGALLFKNTRIKNGPDFAASIKINPPGDDSGTIQFGGQSNSNGNFMIGQWSPYWTSSPGWTTDGGHSVTEMQ